MSTMRSPIRKGHSSQTQRAAPNHFVKKSDGVEASDISNATDEIRSCQANRVLHGCEGDSLQLKLKALNYSLKWNEKEAQTLFHELGRIEYCEDVTSFVDCISFMLNRLSESGATNTGVLKCSEVEGLMVLLLLRLCDERNANTETEDSSSTVMLAQTIFNVLRVAGAQLHWVKPWAYSVLLHSVRPMVGSSDRSNTCDAEKVTLLEALGHACVYSDCVFTVEISTVATAPAAVTPTTAVGEDMSSTTGAAGALYNQALLRERVRGLCGSPLLPPAEARKQAVEVITTHIHAAHVHLSKLPVPAAAAKPAAAQSSAISSGAKPIAAAVGRDGGAGGLVTALESTKLSSSAKTSTEKGEELAADGTARYKETEGQLRLLLASLRALAHLFEQCGAGHNAGAGGKNAGGAKLSAPEIHAYFGLVPLIDRMLRNVMPTLGRRLLMIAESAERAVSVVVTAKAPEQQQHGFISPVHSSVAISANATSAVSPSMAPAAPAASVGSAGTRTAAGSVDAVTPKKSLLGKTDAYRPPSQRSSTGPVAASKKSDSSSSSSNNSASTAAVPVPSAPAAASVPEATSTAGTAIKTTSPTTAVSSPYAFTMVTLKGQLSTQLVRLLGAIAALNTTLFVNSWGLFLSDSIPSETSLLERCSTIVRSVTVVDGATATSAIAAHPSEKLGTTAPLPVGARTTAAVSSATHSSPLAVAASALGAAKLTSPLLGTMLHSPTTEVRAAAVTALLRILSGLPLRTYFTVARPGTIGRFETRSSSTSRAVGGATSGTLGAPTRSQQQQQQQHTQPHQQVHSVYGGGGGGGVSANQSGAANAMSRQQKLLLKILVTVVVALDTELNETVLELLLKLASLLLDQMPLSDDWSTGRGVRLSSLLEGANVCEGRAMALYVLALRAALRYELPWLAQSVTLASRVAVESKSRSISASYVALVWVAERCKSANQSNALLQALHVSYLPRDTSDSGSQGDNRGNSGRSLIYAAAQCLLRAVAPANTNNLYCMAVRTLNSCLAQYFPALYLADPAWLRNVLSVLEIHAQPGLRLQGSKMMAFLLDYDLPKMVVLPAHLSMHGDFVRDIGVGSATYAATYTQCSAAGRTLKENVVSMLKSCVDDAHIVRTQAMAAVGSLTAYAWRVLHGITCSKDEHAQYSSLLGAKGAAAALTMRLLLLRCLLVGANDSVGTVRTAAYKSLGDCVVNSALLLSAAPPIAVGMQRAAMDAGATSCVYHPLLNPAELGYMNDLISCLATGILDTKLSVRVQAAWALGNTVVNLLPYRWAHGTAPVAQRAPALRTVVASAAIASSAAAAVAAPLPYWLTDNCWIALFSDLLPLLHDSEKLAATAIRCVGNVAAGLFPHVSQMHHETVCALHESLIQRYLVPSYTAPSSTAVVGVADNSSWQVLSNLRTPVVEHTQKVVFSLAQSMGFILHALSLDVGRMDTVRYISEVMEVHVSFLKYGKLKTQLQAAQILLYGLCLSQPQQQQQSGELSKQAAACMNTTQLVRLLECLLSLAGSTLPSKTSAVASVAPVARGPTAALLPGAAGDASIAADGSTKELASTTAGAGVGESEDTPEEVVLLFRSRAAELLHYFVLLLHTVLSQLHHSCCGDDALAVGVLSGGVFEGSGGNNSSGGEGERAGQLATRQSVLELLLYYGEHLAVWAEALCSPAATTTSTTSSSANTTYSSGNTTVGLPHVGYDICGALQCRGKSHLALVAEIAALVVRFSSPSDNVSNSTRVQAGEPLQRLPSLASEQLPAALSARFAQCAQYASASYRRALFGDSDYYYSALTQQFAAAGLGGVGDTAGGKDGNYSYGVFDGLDVQGYFTSFPHASAAAAAFLASPPRSPHKTFAAGSAGGIEGMSPLGASAAGAGAPPASPGLAYAVQSATAGVDEDEF